MPDSRMEQMYNILPQVGKVSLITLRPAHRAEVSVKERVEVSPEKGLHGDHYSGSSGNRQVTLIQAEHLEGIAKILKKDVIDPRLTRRNIVVSGINLLAFEGRRFRIGEAILEMTGHCHPCSRMEENLGPGGFNAMRGHGGITARVIQGGEIRTGDEVALG